MLLKKYNGLILTPNFAEMLKRLHSKSIQTAMLNVEYKYLEVHINKYFKHLLCRPTAAGSKQYARCLDFNSFFTHKIYFKSMPFPYDFVDLYAFIHCIHHIHPYIFIEAGFFMQWLQLLYNYYQQSLNLGYTQI